MSFKDYVIHKFRDVYMRLDSKTWSRPTADDLGVLIYDTRE